MHSIEARVPWSSGSASISIHGLVILAAIRATAVHPSSLAQVRAVFHFIRR